LNHNQKPNHIAKMTFQETTSATSTGPGIPGSDGSTDRANSPKPYPYPVVTVKDVVDLEEAYVDADRSVLQPTTRKMHVVEPDMSPGTSLNDTADKATRMPQSDDISQPWQNMAVTDISPEDNNEGRDIQEDVFTLFFLSEPCSKPFVYSIIVIALQYTIYGLLLYSLIEDDDPYRDKENTLKVPAFVDIYVSVSQHIALLIAVVTQDDVMYTIELITVGYNPAILASHPSATRAYWVASCVMRFLEGAVGVGIAFVFIVQSSTVIDIFLNFAAVEFVANLDNLGYSLAAAGLIGRAAQAATHDAKEIKLPLRKGNFRKTRQFVIFATVAILVGGLLWLQNKQRKGEFVVGTSCSRLEISFPEEFVKLDHPLDVTNTQRKFLLKADHPINVNQPPLLIYPFFSGEYATANTFIEHRPVYYERGIDDITSGTFVS
jgi:hypothetical protein